MYIVAEGMEFAGKSTLGRELAKHTNARWVMEPFTETQEGRDLKARLVSNTMTMDEEIQGYAMARLMAFRHVVGPVIQAGGEVHSDRNVLTSMAYQADDFVSSEEILAINEKLLKLHGFDIYPDLILFIDIDHETCMARMAKAQAEGREINNKDEMFKDKSRFERYRERYMRALRIMEYRGVEVHILPPEQATLENCLAIRREAIRKRSKRLSDRTESQVSAYSAKYPAMV